jgi:2-desacetyl-2-hydroxyethyl bacteriochlorophyllide A dehydrogenase
MRAMAVVDYARPLEPIDLPMPRPREGEALVRILSCGVCYSDVKIASGHMPFSRSLRLPHVPGHEIVGEVALTTAGVPFAEGQRVVVFNYWACGTCRSCRDGAENICLDLRGWVGFTTPGGFEEYLAVPASALVPLPDDLDPSDAATLSCAVGTSYHAVVARGNVRPGETAVILGVGGVGLHTLQVARACGARVLAVDREPQRLERARELGAEAVHLADEGVGAWASEITHGGADVVVDTAGTAASLAVAQKAVRAGGRVVLVGYTVGQELPLATTDVVLGEVSYLGSRYAKREELARAIELVRTGAVRPAVAEVLDLERANEAIERVAHGGAAGRIVLRVAPAGKGMS